MNKEPQIFAIKGSQEFGKKVADIIGTPLSNHEEREFIDGEHKIRPLVNVRNQNVFVIHSLFKDHTASVNDKLCRLLFFIGALKDSSADKINVVVPYLCYSRKDRRTKPRDPLTTRYIAQLFEAVGTDRIITMDVHNLQAYQNSFRIPTEHLEARKLFVKYLSLRFKYEKITVMSPDFGGAKRAELFRHLLEKSLAHKVPMTVMEKNRSNEIVTGKFITGEVKDRTVIIIDDMISSGNTILRAATACRDYGAKSVLAIAAHGVFTPESNKVLNSDHINEIIVTDTVNTENLSAELIRKKINIISAAPLFAEAIQRIHTGGSISELTFV